MPATAGGDILMGLPKVTAKGRSGDWFAEIQGELPNGIQRRLPCVHNEWRSKEDRYQYDDHHAAMGNPKWPAFLAALQIGQVIETRDTVPEHRMGGWKRTVYVAVWAIGPTELKDGHLLFRFQERLAHLK
jgi:hypothetical protein